jgi:Ran-binding protein 3
MSFFQPLPAAFSNFSTASPFATSTITSPEKKAGTFSNAFASSGFAKLSGSTVSPFGTTSTASPFATSSTASPFGTSSFGGSLKTAASSAPKPSPFGAYSSSTGNIFGSSTSTASPFGQSLTGTSVFGSKPFGGHPPIKGLSNKPAKPFGAPASDDESGGEDGEEGAENGEEPSTFDNEHKKDRRFFEQDCRLLISIPTQ